MNEHNNDSKVHDMHRKITYFVDGEEFTTTQRRQQAAAILRRAGLDPSMYDLGELKGARPAPKRFGDEDLVTIHPGSRFVSIRHAADVA